MSILMKLLGLEKIPVEGYDRRKFLIEMARDFPLVIGVGSFAGYKNQPYKKQAVSNEKKNDARKHVLYLESEDMTHSIENLYQLKINGDSFHSSVIKKIKEKFLKNPLSEYDPEKYRKTIYIDGLYPEDYDLTGRIFNNRNTFFKHLLDSSIPPVDELIIYCHGKPMYLEADFMGTDDISDDLTYSQLQNDEIFENLVRNAFYSEIADLYDYHKELVARYEKHFSPTGNPKDKIISVEDLRNLDKNTLDGIRSGFKENATCQLRSCLPFYNIGRGDEYPVLGSEFAKVLNIPVIGSVGVLTTIDSHKYLKNYSEDLVTAVPTESGTVEIRDFGRIGRD